MTKILNLFPFCLCACLWMGCEAGVGDKCSTSNDCPSGTVCDTDSPSGYCLVPGCELDDECPENSVCIQFSKDQSFCLQKCRKKGDCRSGYTCRDDLGSHAFCYVEADFVYGREDDNEIPFQVEE